MKKAFTIICLIFFIIIFALFGLLMRNKAKVNQIQKENEQYDKYLGQDLIGTQVATIVSKAINNNEINNVQKDNDGKYIDNQENSIKIELKMITIEKTFDMETIYNNGITNFVQNFNLIKFKCSNAEYHKNTGRIKSITFEQLEL